MKIISRSVRRTFHNNDRIGQQSNRTAYRTNQRLRRFQPRMRPESYLRQMRHNSIRSTYRLRSFCRPDRDFTTRFGNYRGIPHFLIRLKLQRFICIYQPSRIIFQQFRIHPFNICRCILQMRAYHAIPVFPVYQLYPSHIHLYQRRTAPLSCLQQYQPYRQTFRPHIFKLRKQATLRPIESKRNI